MQRPELQRHESPRQEAPTETAPGLDVPAVDFGKLKIHRGPAGHATPRTAFTRRRAAIAVVALVLLAAGWKLLFPGVRDVDTTVAVTAYASQAWQLFNATGYVVAQRKAAVASKATGRLQWLGVREGSWAKEGEVIARLESADVDAQLTSAQASVDVADAQVNAAGVELDDAGRSLKRIEGMQNLVAPSTLDDARSRLARASAAVTSARANLAVARANEQYAAVAVEATRIRAPFDGIVLERTANVGEVVTALGAAADSRGAVVVMADMSSLEVEADVSESSIAGIKAGQPCEIEMDAIPDRRFHGVVSRIVPTVDRAKATVTTKIRITDKDRRILPEMSAKATFLSRDSVHNGVEQPLLAVTPDALVDRNGHHAVFVVRDNVVTEIPVTPGDKLGEVIAVSGDLKAGDVLVRKPSSFLRSGDAVRVHQA